LPVGSLHVYQKKSEHDTHATLHDTTRHENKRRKRAHEPGGNAKVVGEAAGAEGAADLAEDACVGFNMGTKES
jgi:hypothetical protein